MNVLLLLPALLAVVWASYDPYEDVVELYRMQLLANSFANYAPESQLLDSRSLDEDSYWPELNSIADQEDAKSSIYNDPKYSGAHLRDQEHLEHSALHGHQSVSGGTAEGANKVKQVKSDRLPAYCNPPNPCPVGKTAKNDNCVDNFENTAENNERLLAEQDCPCDTEHMFQCAAGSQTVSSKSQGSGNQRMALNKVMDELAKIENNANNLENDPVLPSTQKRLTVVAKKSPESHSIYKRSEKSAHGNPYLEGLQIDIAAKKDPNLAKNSMHNWSWEPV